MLKKIFLFLFFIIFSCNTESETSASNLITNPDDLVEAVQKGHVSLKNDLLFFAQYYAAFHPDEKVRQAWEKKIIEIKKEKKKAGMPIPNYTFPVYFYWVRHGATEANIKEKESTKGKIEKNKLLDTRLHPIGIEKSKEAGKYLPKICNEKNTIFLASGLSRAIQTGLCLMSTQPMFSNKQIFPFCYIAEEGNVLTLDNKTSKSAGLFNPWKYARGKGGRERTEIATQQSWLKKTGYNVSKVNYTFVKSKKDAKEMTPKSNSSDAKEFMPFFFKNLPSLLKENHFYTKKEPQVISSLNIVVVSHSHLLKKYLNLTSVAHLKDRLQEDGRPKNDAILKTIVEFDLNTKSILHHVSKVEMVFEGFDLTKKTIEDFKLGK